MRVGPFRIPEVLGLRDRNKSGVRFGKHAFAAPCCHPFIVLGPSCGLGSGGTGCLFMSWSQGGGSKPCCFGINFSRPVVTYNGEWQPVNELGLYSLRRYTLHAYWKKIVELLFPETLKLRAASSQRTKHLEFALPALFWTPNPPSPRSCQCKIPHIQLCDTPGSSTN